MPESMFIYVRKNPRRPEESTESPELESQTVVSHGVLDIEPGSSAGQ